MVMDFLALLGRGDGGGRVPLRPHLEPGARPLEAGGEGLRFDYGSGFLDAVRQDPVLNKTKLIAEPWDLAGGGYQVGGFPPGWAEWNGKFRDTARRYWKGEPGHITELATRLTGLGRHAGPRRPAAQRQRQPGHRPRRVHAARPRLVQREAQRGQRRGQPRRHQRERQLELRRRGADRRPAIDALRARQKRNLLATLLLSQGVPQLLAGDELGNSQGGNNNAYCQDSEISWIRGTRRTSSCSSS
jgi:glycogen operon protein